MLFQKGLRILTVIIFLIFITFVISADSLAEKIKGGGGGGFMFGVDLFDLEELNNKLEENDFEELDNMMPFFGGGGYGLAGGKVVIGGEGGGSFQSIGGENKKASISAGYGFFDLGYVVFSKANLKVFPVFGLGGGGISLKIYEIGKMPNFDEILDEPGREVTLSTGGFMTHASIGMDYLLAMGKDKEGQGGLLVGLRAGYVYSPMKADWKIEDNDVLGGPDVRPNGFYFHIVFGGAGEGY